MHVLDCCVYLQLILYKKMKKKRSYAVSVISTEMKDS